MQCRVTGGLAVVAPGRDPSVSRVDGLTDCLGHFVTFSVLSSVLTPGTAHDLNTASRRGGGRGGGEDDDDDKHRT